LSHCAKCGATLPEDAAYCPCCGASQEAQQVAVSQPQSHRNLSMILVLAGGILGLAFSIFSLAMVPLFVGIMNYHWMTNGLGVLGRYGGYGMMGYPRIGVFFGGVMLLWILLGVTGSILTIYSGLKLGSDFSKASATIAIIGGALLLIAFSWLPALIVLAGSVLAYVGESR
jgi:predicted nucleic acid-binding Zn ribbon protein